MKSEYISPNATRTLPVPTLAVPTLAVPTLPALTLLVLTLVAFTLTTPAFGEDWAQWRGPNRDAKSLETGLLEKWPEDGPHLPGKQTALAEGIQVLLSPTVASSQWVILMMGAMSLFSMKLTVHVSGKLV